MKQLITQLENFKKNIADSEIDEKLLYDKYETFRSIFKNNEEKKVNKLLSSKSKALDEFQSFFENLEKQYIKTIEFKTSKSILNCETQYDLLIRLTTEHVVYERNLINTENVNTLIMIGSGPYPETMIYYAQKTSINKIIGIDYDENAIKVAKEITRKLNIQNKISFIHSNAENIDYQEADVIIIGNYISPKFDILKRVSVASKNEIKILLRIPTKLDRLVYEYISNEKILNLNLKIDRVLDKAFDIGQTSLLLTKR